MKEKMEEAELWEQIQFILVDGTSRELEEQKLVDFANNEFADRTRRVDANGSVIENLVLPDNITSIGGSAFSGCTALTEVNLPDNLVNIPANLFNNFRYNKC